MSGIYKGNIELSIFGESHGKAIGITIDGLPPGIELDLNFIKNEMKRRAPGGKSISTSRKEEDNFEILSGYFRNKTTGTPLCALIYNKNVHSKDYKELEYILRPGHGDYTGKVKYKGYNDFRGGGHFSGRITAPLVFAGAICKQILSKLNILIISHIYSIGNIKDKAFTLENTSQDLLKKLIKESFPTVSKEKANIMQEEILKAKEDNDSVGGIIETIAINVPAGLGSPFFDSFESVLSKLLFSIPAVKGVEFGEGFNIAKLRGSQAKDEYYTEENNIKTYTNNNGGILGGITNGMPVAFKTAFKPTPSIGKKQNTVNICNKENTQIEIKGRHDPCIVPRAVPVVEAVTAITILDFIMEDNKMNFIYE